MIVATIMAMTINCDGDEDDGDSHTLFRMSVFALASSKRCKGWTSREGEGTHISSYHMHTHKINPVRQTS